MRGYGYSRVPEKPPQRVAGTCWCCSGEVFDEQYGQSWEPDYTTVGFAGELKICPNCKSQMDRDHAFQQTKRLPPIARKKTATDRFYERWLAGRERIKGLGVCLIKPDGSVVPGAIKLQQEAVDADH